MDTIAFGVGVRKVSWPDGYGRVVSFSFCEPLWVVSRRSRFKARLALGLDSKFEVLYGGCLRANGCNKVCRDGFGCGRWAHQESELPEEAECAWAETKSPALGRASNQAAAVALGIFASGTEIPSLKNITSSPT